MKYLYKTVINSLLEQTYTATFLARAIYSFVRGGYISSEIPNPLIAALLSHVIPLKIQDKENIQQIPEGLLIPLAWSLCIAQRIDKPNPLTTFIIEKIFRQKKKHLLIRDDMIELHQLAGYIDIMVSHKKWLKATQGLINKKVRDLALSVCRQNERCKELDVRDEIVDILERKGLAADDETWVKGSWRADIRFKNFVIILTGKWRVNEDGEPKGREYMKEIGLRNTAKEIMFIDADKWKELDKRDKDNQIEDIVRKVIKTSRPSL